MKRISSRLTGYYKFVFPTFWFGFLGIFLFAFPYASGGSIPLPMLVVPAILIVFGFVLFRKLLWDLVDEVIDCGDKLLIRNRGDELTVPLSAIMNVSALILVNPNRVTLRLVTPSKFGDEISFLPIRPFSLNPFARNPLVDDLIKRVDQARRFRSSN